MTFLPPFDPDTFTPGQIIDNRYFPLRPGTIQTYFGSVEDEEGEEHTEGNDFFVTRLTTDIAGVQVIIVRDTAYDDGLLVEDTIDWFAQDQAGNVWYLGETVNNYIYDDEGNFVETNHNGSWEAGVDGALPGWIMEALPRVGDAYYQEFLPGVAVDEALVTARGLTLDVDDRTYNRVLQIREESALEPGIFGFKYYAPGVGMVREEEFNEDGELEFVSELIGTRNLARTDQRGLETPEQDDFEGEGDFFYVQVTGADTDAVNALGAYTFDLETGVIGEAWIVYDAIEPGESLGSVRIEVEEGQGLGLFLVPNAEDLGIDLSDYEDGGLFFINMATGGAATFGDGMAPIIVDEDGQALPMQAFHMLGSGYGYNLLNPGAGINAIEGEWRGRGDDVEMILFEDTRVTDPEFDGDFDDLIVIVSEDPISRRCGTSYDKDASWQSDYRAEQAPEATYDYAAPFEAWSPPVHEMVPLVGADLWP
jgi:hypothetical protein